MGSGDIMKHLLIIIFALSTTSASALVWEGGARNGNIEDRRAISFRRLYGVPSASWVSQNLSSDGKMLVQAGILRVAKPSHGGQAVRIQVMSENSPSAREFSYDWNDDKICEMLFANHSQGFGHTAETVAVVPGIPDSGTIVHQMYCGTQFVNPFIIMDAIAGDR
jgi:hypothetical protein